MMMLSLTSDYVDSYSRAEDQLRQMAEAGFTHVHWCHEWNTDHLFSSDESEQIARWHREFGLTMLNVHASDGQKKHWASLQEDERLAGVELVQNRIELAARHGSDVIIMHPPEGRAPAEAAPAVYGQWRKSLDALEPFARARGVRIAIENMADDNFVFIRKALADYSPGFLGHCYDSGHGNIGGKGLDHLEPLKDRLLAVHLHDNDGKNDQHKIMMTGTVDWPRLARIVAQSSYDKCVNSESTIHQTGIKDEREFLRQALEQGMVFARMLGERKACSSGI